MKPIRNQAPSIKKNAVLNVIKTLMSLLFPLVTYPYASRILLPEGMGRIAFSNSIVSYFQLLAGLGIFTYAVREGTRFRNDRERIRDFAADMFSINVYATVLAYMLLILGSFCIPRLQPYRTTILILSIQIALTTMGVAWIYSVYEDYAVQTVLMILMQAASLVCLFLFVHTPADLNRYAVITVAAYYGMGLVLFFYSRRYVRVSFRLKPELSHLRPILIIFSMMIASTVYINSDLTMLGWIAGDRYTGLYGTAANIYKIVKELLNAIVIVAIPRFAFYLGNGREEELRELSSSLINTMAALCLPAMTGIFFLAGPIVKVFAGEAFAASAPSLRLLSIALVFAVFANYHANFVLLSYKKERTVLTATIISAAVNVILNLFLLPVLYEKGAAFTTILAEVIMFWIVRVYSRKELKTRISGKNLFSVVIGCGVIAAVCTAAQQVFAKPAVALAVCVILSAAAYFFLQIVMKNTAVTGLLRLRQHNKA